MADRITFSICKTSIHNFDVKPLQDDRVYKRELKSGYTAWFIDFTPEELLEFCKSIGSPVIVSLVGEPIDGGSWDWALEIYDDYRE